MSIEGASLPLVLVAAVACVGCHRGAGTPPRGRADAGAATAELGPGDAGAAVADAGVAAPPCLSEAMANMEPHDRWMARFEGTPAADKRPPPKIGALADLKKLAPSQLAFVRGGRVFAMALPGGAERALTSGGHDARPIWSPRGTHVAFIRAANDVSRAHLVRADGADLRQISPAPVSGALTWSSDGRYLAFRSDAEIIVHDLQTSADRRLPTPPGSRSEDVDPVFERSGTRLAFAFNREVYVADAATGVVERHEWGERNEVMSLAFASGGLRISMNAAQERPSQTLVRRLALDHKGKLEGELFPTPSVGAGVELFAAPDGAHIALTNASPERSVTTTPGGETIVQMGDWLRRSVAFYDVRRPRQDTLVTAGLPQPRFSTGAPTWAPDSRHLGFVVELWHSTTDDQPLARGIVAVDTDHPKALVHVACGEMPAWGPASP